MKLMRFMVFLAVSTVLGASSSGTVKPLFLWQASKGETVLYLFGTMHLADPSLQKLPAQLEKVLSGSDAIYTEVAIEPAVQMRANELMIRRDSRTLKSILPAALYKRSSDYLRSINPALKIYPFEKMKLWAFSATLQFLEARMKYPNLPSIDAVIYRKAKALGKETGGIESIEEQLAAMEALSDKEQLLMHEATLDYLEENKDYTEKMRALYVKGDEKALMDYIMEVMFTVEKYRQLEQRLMQLLLYDRNIRMAERIMQKVTENPQKVYLFAFGAMHFLDKGSVIELLEKEGFRIERIRE
ncbi:MAG: TraB/GumN family protein [Sulfurimonas sp.]